jgi:hypothetical protein
MQSRKERIDLSALSKKLDSAALACTLIAVLLSVLPLLVGAIVFALLAAGCAVMAEVVLHRAKRRAPDF